MKECTRLMRISDHIDNLNKEDIYSLMLFVLYKCNESNEFSSLSQLSYILDLDNLLKLCEFYGGQTITLPTIAELRRLLDALLLYQLVEIEHKDIEKLSEEYNFQTVKLYRKIKEILNDYSFNSGRNNHEL